ncbi:hypothetical protein HY251_10080 [bacterium]|nr:hypothetical protein [bacterium]
MLRSIGAVILGYLTLMILVIAFDVTILLVATGGKIPEKPDPEKMRSLGTFYSVANATAGFFFAIAAGYVTAWVARRRELAHACVLAAITAGLGTLMFVGRLNAAERPEPLWYLATVYIAWPILCIPLGGLLRARHVRSRWLSPEIPIDAVK